VYNFNKIKNIKLKPEYEKLERCIKIMLPIFDRIMDNDKVSIDNVPITNSANTISTPTIKVENLSEFEDYPFVNTSTTPIVQTTTGSDSSDDEDVIDEEGDAQVEEITKQSLELLHKIRNNGWILIENDNEYDVESDETDGYESEHSDDTTPQTDDNSQTTSLSPPEYYQEFENEFSRNYMNDDVMAMYG
jgi:hypothetical protein